MPARFKNNLHHSSCILRVQKDENKIPFYSYICNQAVAQLEEGSSLLKAPACKIAGNKNVWGAIAKERYLKVGYW